ncbi:MAG: hypothetical protein LBV79_11595 [Candidatus Adiutrix sp.]|jgi:hypothetical protein|nr:hypothetical protein [Candidatus Adiutrix sp.]
MRFYRELKRAAAFRVVGLAALLAVLAGCGAVLDMAEDNEWRWGFFGKVKFISPVKLRIGVAPFSDDVGLGAAEAGSNLARLMSAEMAKDSNLVVVPAEAVEAAMAARGYTAPLTPLRAAEIGTDLRLNALVLGSLSEVKKYNLRKGWRRLARIVTEQHEYVNAVLAVSAVDSATGIVLVSRANTGEYDGGSGNDDFFEAGDRTGHIPSQEALESSLDDALTESYYRTLTGLAALPFKARVLSVTGGQAHIGFGSDVDLRKGREFVKLLVEEVVTNSIGDSYQIMGAPVARLKVAEVGESGAALDITDGQVAPGDVIQAVD